MECLVFSTPITTAIPSRIGLWYRILENKSKYAAGMLMGSRKIISRMNILSDGYVRAISNMRIAESQSL